MAAFAKRKGLTSLIRSVIIDFLLLSSAEGFSRKISRVNQCSKNNEDYQQADEVRVYVTNPVPTFSSCADKWSYSMGGLCACKKEYACCSKGNTGTRANGKIGFRGKNERKDWFQRTFHQTSLHPAVSIGHYGMAF